MKDILHKKRVKMPPLPFTTSQRPVNEKCPQCGSYMTVKGKYVVSSGQNCTFRKELEKDE